MSLKCTIKSNSIMRVLNKRLLIKFDNDYALQESVDIGDGMKLYISGEERPEHWANVVGEVVASGVKGIEVGDKVGVSYQVIFKYDYVGDTRIYTSKVVLDDDSVVWVVEYNEILCKIEGDKYIGWGDWVLLRAIENDMDEQYSDEAKKIVEGLIVNHKALNPVVKGRAKFISGDIDCKEGDVVLFEEKYRSKYEFGYKNEFIVLSKDLILGKINN